MSGDKDTNDLIPADGEIDPFVTSAYSEEIIRLPDGEIAEAQKEFPGYELIEEIGRGGMGVVYKAYHTQLDRLVAIKVLSDVLRRGEMFKARFLREARAMAKLSHHNLVTVYDFGEVGGNLYFVMEFVEGVDLHKLIKTGKLSPDQALQIVAQICVGLEYAHDQGIVHRDIKPGNILVEPNGRVRIADFGIAKLLGKGDEPEMTSLTGTQAMGSMAYIAPEQLEDSAHVDHRADIYSLGVMFYEMLTGEVPRGRFLPPSKKSGVDARLDEIVDVAMQQDPDQRYQSVTQFRSDIETIITDPTGELSAGVEEESAVPPPKSHLGAILGVVSAALALGAAGWFFGLKPAIQKTNTGPVILPAGGMASERAAPPEAGGSVPAAVADLSGSTPPPSPGQVSQEDPAVQNSLGLMYLNGAGVEQNYFEALKYFEKSAAQKNAEGLFQLGWMYQQGLGVDADPSAAAEWYRQAAEQGFARAQLNLGLLYRQGLGVAQDTALAVKWIRQAAEQGDAASQNMLGRLYQEGDGVPQDYVEAGVWFRKSASASNAEGQYLLGNLYRHGLGFEKDFALALTWLRLSTEQGYAGAEESLGDFYRDGLGVRQDASQAVEWYRRAAEKGHAPAQVKLGAMYGAGTGIGQDHAEALKWFGRAAAQGDAGAQFHLGEMFFRGVGVARDPVKAAEWMQKAADQNHPGGQNGLGLLYQEGAGVERDETRAVEWFFKAAEQGLVEAQNNAGLACQRGAGIEQSPRQALEWFQKSASQGNADGQFYLGMMYLKGAGVEVDYELARELLLKAAAQGQLSAQLNLAIMYDKGLGVDPSEEEAMKWVNSAIAAGSTVAKDWLDERAKALAEKEEADRRRLAEEEEQKRPKPVVGQNWTSPISGMEFVWVPAMEGWVGKYEVTNGEYRKYRRNYRSLSMGLSLDGDRQPVVNINYNQHVNRFLRWMNDNDRLPEGLVYRVPTDEEWMLFAKSGGEGVYPWGNSWPPTQGNYDDEEVFNQTSIRGFKDGFPATCDVENSGGNAWGIFGVGGNVWEMTADVGGGFSALRGGSWRNDRKEDLMLSARTEGNGLAENNHIGFRVVILPAP